jgi:hypothetical protein
MSRTAAMTAGARASRRGGVPEASLDERGEVHQRHPPPGLVARGRHAGGNHSAAVPDHSRSALLGSLLHCQYCTRPPQCLTACQTNSLYARWGVRAAGRCWSPGARYGAAGTPPRPRRGLRRPVRAGRAVWIGSQRAGPPRLVPVAAS